MKNNKLFLYAFIPWLSFINGAHLKNLDSKTITIGLGDQSCQNIVKSFKVEIASTSDSRAKGLSNRKSKLSESEGMLFCFYKPFGLVSFWMKDTYIPLDLGYFNEAGKLSQYMEMQVEADPSHPKKTYDSIQKTIAALEVAKGSLQNQENKHLILCVQK